MTRTRPLFSRHSCEDVRRQPELLGGQNLRRNHAEDGAAALAVHEDVGAEAGEPGDLVGEVGVVPSLELVAVLRRHDRIQQRDDVVRRQRRRIRLQRLNLAVLSHERRHADAQVKVGRSTLAHQAEQTVDGGGVQGLGLGHWCISGHRSAFSITSTMWSELTITVPNGVTTYRKCLTRRV